ncbi:hypothetical protein [Maribacter sp. 2308TA10-17]|uniref:hypothetical protein n=1 Tax=Maribacter sp. 2308TA10-17 TaxID=3386276 RepID=UPI0039BD078B
MKFLSYFLLVIFTLAITSCKSGSSTTSNEKPLQETLNEKNRQSITLLNRIRRLSGITLRGGVPILAKGNTSIQSNTEPLYILDNYPVGNSFKAVNDLVVTINVKKVEILSLSDASFYGSRAANGVIKITTYK